MRPCLPQYHALTGALLLRGRPGCVAAADLEWRLAMLNVLETELEEAPAAKRATIARVDATAARAGHPIRHKGERDDDDY